MAELKPCPFCGSEDVRLRWHMGTATYGVFCRGCVVDFLMYFEVRDDVIEAWNRRDDNGNG